MNGGVADSARRMHSMNRRSCSADRSATAWLAGQQRRVAVGRAARPRWLLLPQTEGERDGETDRQTDAHSGRISSSSACFGRGRHIATSGEFVLNDVY